MRSHLAHVRAATSSTQRPDTVSREVTSMPVGDQLLNAVDTFEHERGRTESCESRAAVAFVATRSARVEDRAVLGGRTHILSML